MLQATVKTIWCFTSIPPPLLQFRVIFTFPFSHTGVDFMGPLFVRNVFFNKDETLHKVFIVVYTCASSRVIRLDVDPDASCSSLILSLKTIYFC